MANIHRDGYELKVWNSSFLEIYSKMGMQQISVVKKNIGSWGRSEMGRKDRRNQLKGPQRSSALYSTGVFTDRQENEIYKDQKKWNCEPT